MQVGPCEPTEGWTPSPRIVVAWPRETSLHGFSGLAAVALTSSFSSPSRSWAALGESSFEIVSDEGTMYSLDSLALPALWPVVWSPELPQAASPRAAARARMRAIRVMG